MHCGKLICADVDVDVVVVSNEVEPTADWPHTQLAGSRTMTMMHDSDDDDDA